MKKQRLGLTLIELIVVVAILAVLAMIVLPKLDGLQSNANHAVAAASVDDTARYIQMYKTTKYRFPDGYDSLMNAAGTGLWAAADPSTSTKGLHIQLSGSGSNNKLSTTTLNEGEVTALQSAGIYTLYNLQSSSSARPGDMFNVKTSVAGSTPTVAIINPSSSGGKKIIDHIYRDNLLSTGTSGALTGSTSTSTDGSVETVTSTKLIVFGFGPHNALIGKTMVEVPNYPHVDATLVYNRNLVVFELATTTKNTTSGGSTTSSSTAKVAFKAVVGADGDILDDLNTSMSKDAT
ncbi:MAG: prepilin-type N-terminal cleavage/methylation domain-containing protein [Planctomycetia bacterium]|nr:prepilin-type N-terminal cleavage/methylation domain-containing protein [Planctomycetia bacterium]